MIKAVAFDLDHTLYDRDATYENLAEDFRAYFSAYLRKDLSREVLLKTLCDCDRSGIYKDGHWEGIYRDTLKSGIFCETPSYETYYKGFIEKRYPPAMVLYKDTLSTLDGLRKLGYSVGILTNGPSDYQRMKVEMLRLHEHVDAVAVGGELEHQKPHRCAFDYICRQMNCRPAEAVYVGDHPINDVRGALNAGLLPVWIRSVGSWPQDLEPAGYSIDTLSELPALLELIRCSPV